MAKRLDKLDKEHRRLFVALRYPGMSRQWARSQWLYHAKKSTLADPDYKPLFQGATVMLRKRLMREKEGRAE